MHLNNRDTLLYIFNVRHRTEARKARLHINFRENRGRDIRARIHSFPTIGHSSTARSAARLSERILARFFTRYAIARAILRSIIRAVCPRNSKIRTDLMSRLNSIAFYNLYALGESNEIKQVFRRAYAHAWVCAHSCVCSPALLSKSRIDCNGISTKIYASTWRGARKFRWHPLLQRRAGL